MERCGAVAIDVVAVALRATRGNDTASKFALRFAPAFAALRRGRQRSGYKKLDGYEAVVPCGAVFLGRFSRVICLIRAESDGLHVATSGSSLKALWTRRRS